MLRLSRFLPCLSLAILPAVGLAQVIVGQQLRYAGNVSPTGIETNIDLYAPANLIGAVTKATFGWSNSPCPAAAKIKFFRPTAPGNPQAGFTFLAERGPFDVTQPVQTAQPLLPPVTQEVDLGPPVLLQPGDVVAITNLTQCGGPTFVGQVSSTLPPVPSASFPVAGDVTTSVQQPATTRAGIFVSATGDLSGLLLLNRFRVTLEATDPRTGRRATGVPNPVGTTEAAGYFSLPDFTGDPHFPEVTVKMADATANPILGGTFWFFHAPLTDVTYTLTVDDLVTGRSRTYPSIPSTAAGQLCGAADTSAFVP